MQDRRRQLRTALDLGPGKVEVLINLTDAGRDAAQRGQAILNDPPPALTTLDADDLARLDEILTRLRNDSRPL